MIDADSIAVVLDVLEPERAALVALLEGLEPDDWTRSTECPAYTITGVATHVLGDERGWRELFDELGLTPYEVLYEELVTEDGYRRTVLGVLEHLGLDTSGVGTLPPPGTHRQADELNEGWVVRYTSERRAGSGPR